MLQREHDTPIGLVDSWAGQLRFTIAANMGWQDNGAALAWGRVGSGGGKFDYMKRREQADYFVDVCSFVRCFFVFAKLSMFIFVRLSGVCLFWFWVGWHDLY